MPKRAYRKFLPVSKTINGKQYLLNGVASNKSRAKAKATEQRKYGKNARIIATGKTKGKKKAPIKKGFRYSQATGPKRGRWGVYTKNKTPRKRSK